MKTIIIILTACGLVGLSRPAAGNDVRAALLIDGKVRTDGLSLHGARVIIGRDGIQINVLTGDVGRIQLPLDLGHVYILSFERMGCMTKEVLFDTHVPIEAMAFAPFTFPFKVTLEERGPGSPVRYSQPVASVRYYPERSDFGYDTDYSTYRERAMRQARRTPSSQPPSDPDVDHDERPLANPPKAPSADTRPIATQSAPAVGAGMGHRPVRQTRPVEDREVRAWSADQTNLPDGRSEELLVRPTYVARTIRIRTAGHEHEYRKVTHRDGTEYYFQDGTSCGRTTYLNGVAEP